MRTKYKIVFLGEQNVGKSTLISQFVYKSIEDKYQPTIGIDFLSKTIEIDGKDIKLQIWDTAGQEKFNSIISSYARNSFVAVVVYDLNRVESLNSINKTINDLIKVHDKENKIKILIVGNKADLLEEDEKIKSISDGINKAKEHGAIFLETCAKTYDGIKVMEEYFVKVIKDDLINEIEENYSISEEKKPKQRCC